MHPRVHPIRMGEFFVRVIEDNEVSLSTQRQSLSKKMKRDHEELLPLYTYCPGPSIRAANNITTKTMVSLIDALCERFGPGSSFALEPISEGGIQMTSIERGFKTFRFNFQPYGNYGKWPFIDGQTTLQSWRDDENAAIIWNGRGNVMKGDLFLKAFYGAPCWTRDELTKVASALASVGITCPTTGWPSNRKLQKRGDLGRIDE